MNSRENLYSVIRGLRTAMLVSQTAEGALHVRPMAVAEIKEDGEIYFATSLDSPKITEIEHNPEVLVTFQNGLQFASLAGHARIVRDEALIETLWSEAWRVWFPEGMTDPNLCVIKVESEVGEYWNNAGLSGLKYVFESVKTLAHGSTPNANRTQHAKISL